MFIISSILRPKRLISVPITASPALSLSNNLPNLRCCKGLREEIIIRDSNEYHLYIEIFFIPVISRFGTVIFFERKGTIM